MKLVDEIASKIVGGGEYLTGEPGDDLPGLGGGGGDEDDDIFGGSFSQQGVGRHGLPSIEHQTVTQRLGFDGTGVVVAVADSGLHNGDAESMHPDSIGRVDAFFHYGSLSDAADEHSHGTHVTGIVAGTAPPGKPTSSATSTASASLRAPISSPSASSTASAIRTPPTYETLTRDAVRAGAVIGSNSWGDDTQGRYDLSAAEFDALVRDADELSAGEQPYILEFSAGNAGPGPKPSAAPPSPRMSSPQAPRRMIATDSSSSRTAPTPWPTSPVAVPARTAASNPTSSLPAPGSPRFSRSPPPTKTRGLRFPPIISTRAAPANPGPTSRAPPQCSSSTGAKRGAASRRPPPWSRPP
jgi:hypothetical protein